MSKENPLKDQILKYIRDNGPISYSHYTSAALTDPKHGYYMNSNMFNKEGDFVTSPEISQLFGEMIAIWICFFWEKVAVAAKHQKYLIEFGAGTGKLMSNILEIVHQLGNLENLKITIVEVSPFLRNLQQTNLNSFFAKKQLIMSFEENKDTQRLFCKKANVEVEWIFSWTNFLSAKKEVTPDSHFLFINNEFFDALPIIKFQYVRDKWHEVLIDIKADEKKPLILTSSQTNAQVHEHQKNMDKHGFFKVNKFLEVLSSPNNISVEKFLKPEYRFQNKSELKNGMTFELCPLGSLIRNNDREFGRSLCFGNKWSCVVYRLWRRSCLHRFTGCYLKREFITTSIFLKKPFWNCLG